MLPDGLPAGGLSAGGSVTDPEKRYHLELDTGHAQASREVAAC